MKGNKNAAIFGTFFWHFAFGSGRFQCRQVWRKVQGNLSDWGKSTGLYTLTDNLTFQLGFFSFLLALRSVKKVVDCSCWLMAWQKQMTRQTMTPWKIANTVSIMLVIPVKRTVRNAMPYSLFEGVADVYTLRVYQ